MSLYLELLRFELLVALKTRRALAMATLYLGSAVMGALAYTAILKTIEERMSQQATSGLMADLALAELAEPIYAAVATFFTGVSPDAMAGVFRESPMVTLTLFSALMVIPSLIVMTTFDLLAADVQTRTVYYPLLRASRTQLLLAKVSAHVVFFTVLSALASLVVAAVVGVRLGPEHLRGAPLGLVRVWLSLVPVGLFYVSLTASFSAWVRQPTAAMFATYAAMFVLWLVRNKEGLRYLSPSTYVSGLWYADVTEVALSIGAFLGLAALCLAVANAIFTARDLT